MRGRGRGWLRGFVAFFVAPTLLGGVVWLVGGRPLTFDLIRRAVAARFPDVRWIGTAEMAAWRADAGRPQPVLLDARTEAEYAVSHLEGARRIDPERPSLSGLGAIPRDTPVVVYCSVGYRSAEIARWLGARGYRAVQNLAGSIFRWANEGRPVYRGDQPVGVVHPYDRTWGLLLESRYRADVPPVEGRAVAP